MMNSSSFFICVSLYTKNIQRTKATGCYVNEQQLTVNKQPVTGMITCFPANAAVDSYSCCVCWRSSLFCRYDQL